MTKRLIIYDLDGTLVDTREDIARSANHMREVFNLAPLDQAVIEGFVGRGLHFLVKSCLQTDDPKTLEKGSKIYRAFYAEHMLDHTLLYPGAKEVLDFFKDRLQAVITNKPNPYSRQILEALGVAGYFVEIVAGDTDYPKKPDPSAVLAIMEREKITSTETLFVGDSVIDIETGRNAGVETVVISHGFEGEDTLQSENPEAVVSSFSELLVLARQKEW
ncbi:MAG TPA: HAD-IA family hydrolase [bacterium]|nr:HAD-IA family hydrolase [bacterium]